MKIQASRNELLKPIAAVVPAIERSTLPVLQNILVQAQADNTRFVATDLEMELRLTTTDCIAESPSAITLPGKRLHDILRAFPDNGVVTLDVDHEKAKATVRCGRSRFTLQTMPADEFPAPDDREFFANITVPQGGLKTVIKRTAYAMAKQDVRYYLNGCLFDFDQKGVRVIATDGHRLAYNELLNTQIDADEPGQVILPLKGVLNLLKLLDDTEAPATLQIGANHLRVQVGELCLTSKLIDGKFPDYQRVIPKNYDKVAIIERVGLAELFKRVGLVLTDKTTGIRLELDQWKLTASSKNSDQEEAEEEMDINYNGDKFETGMNVSYLQDTINALSGELVKLSFADSASSILLEEAEGGGGLHVIMPMRL